MGLTYSDLNGITEVTPNKEYKIRISTGNRLRKTVHGTLLKTIQTKKNLEKVAEQSLIERPKEIRKVMESVTFEEASMRTIDYLVDLAEKTDAIDLNTVYDYADRIEMYLYDFFPKGSKLASINENKVKEFVSYMFNRERKDGKGLLSLQSVKKGYSTLSWIIRYCSEISNPPLLKENCLYRIKFKTLIPKGRGQKKRRNRSHSSQEIYKLIETLESKANIRLKTMINIALDVGCRDEECLGLKWSNVDLNTGEINYSNAVTSHITKKNNSKHSGTRIKELKSKHSYRKNYLTENTIQNLRNLKVFKQTLGLSVNDSDYIFTIWGDNTILSPISFADEYKDFRKKYNLGNIPYYDFRHYVSNLLLESGVSDKDISMYLGNSPRTLRESYTDIKEETEKNICDIVKNKVRSNKYKNFNIDSVVRILNSRADMNDDKVYEILDFIENKKVTQDEIPFCLEKAKQMILEQYPMLETFCNDDDKIVQAKLETYKMFNNVDIELTKSSEYYLSKIRI